LFTAVYITDAPIHLARMSSLISVIIKKDPKQEADRLGINIRSVLDKRRREEFKIDAEDIVKCMSDVDTDDFSKR